MQVNTTAAMCFDVLRTDYDRPLQHNPEIGPLNLATPHSLVMIHLNNMVQCQM